MAQPRRNPKLVKPGHHSYSSHVQTASLTEAKNQLSALIDRVRGGESVLILDRGIPVARLESVTPLDEGAAGPLARLERAGAVRAAHGKAPLELISRDPPQPRGGASVVEALLEERRAER